MSINALDCPSCEDQLPVWDFNACGPDIKYQGVLGLLLARPGEGFANIDDAAEHTSRTSNTSTDTDAIRRLTGVGSFTPEFGDERTIGRLTFYGKNVATVVLKVYDNSDGNYEAHRLMGCNTSYSVWVLGSNNEVYGGNDGFQMVLTAREVIGENLEEEKYIEITGKVKYTNAYPRDTYPLAGELDGLI